MAGSFREQLAKFIGVITIPPVFASFAITWIFVSYKSGLNWYLQCLLFLSVIPISAYFLKDHIPAVKEHGRQGERELAFITGIIGYVVGAISCIAFKMPAVVKTIIMTYFTAGIILTAINKLTHIKASGHACGVSGPLTLLTYFVQAKLWLSLLVISVVFWARLVTGRHNLKELIIGNFVGVFSALINIKLF